MSQNYTGNEPSCAVKLHAVKIRWSSVLIRAIAVTLAIERGFQVNVAMFKYIAMELW